MWIHVGRTWRQWRSRGCRPCSERALGRAKALEDRRRWEPECMMHQRYRQPDKGQHGWCVWQKENNELHRLDITQPPSQESVRIKCTSTVRQTWLTIIIIFKVIEIRQKQKRILCHYVTHWSVQQNKRGQHSAQSLNSAINSLGPMALHFISHPQALLYKMRSSYYVNLEALSDQNKP